MTNDYTSLSYEKMNEYSNELGFVSGALEENLNEVKALINKIGDSDVWAGTAAEKSKEAILEFATQFPMFVQSINECKEALDKIVSNYEEADSVVTGGN